MSHGGCLDIVSISGSPPCHIQKDRFEGPLSAQLEALVIENMDIWAVAILGRWNHNIGNYSGTCNIPKRQVYASRYGPPSSHVTIASWGPPQTCSNVSIDLPDFKAEPKLHEAKEYLRLLVSSPLSLNILQDKVPHRGASRRKIIKSSRHLTLTDWPPSSPDCRIDGHPVP